MNFRWLTTDDMGDYAELAYQVSENMIASNKANQVDFLSTPECYKALKEGRVYSMWDGERLVVSLIAGESDIGTRYKGDFSEFDGKAVYLRNGMVHPDYIGRGLYSQFMQAIAAEIDSDLVGTITVDNIAAQYACASAGFELVDTVPYLNKADKVVLMCRYLTVESGGVIFSTIQKFQPDEGIR